MSGDENLWYVKTTDGDVHRVSLDQLDEAFQAGRIDENVMVLPAGSTEWARLAELAGLDDPQPKRPEPRPVSPAPLAPIPNSLRPVSTDLSLDLDDLAFQKKSRTPFVIGAFLIVVAVFGGLLFANRAHLAMGSSSAAVPAAAPPAPPPPTPAADPAPSVPPPSPVATTPPADANAAKLNEEQRAKLTAADKALEAKTKGRKKSHGGAGAPASHGTPKYKAQGFTTGGNKYDPLNASM